MPVPKSKTTGDEVVGSKSLYVYVEKCATVNTGDYNNRKVTVGITLPFNPTPEDIAQAKKAVRIAISVVDPILEDEIDDILKDYDMTPAKSTPQGSKILKKFKYDDGYSDD